MQKIHISTLRNILAAPDPVDLKVWAAVGRILEYRNVVPLHYNFYEGTRTIKLLGSRQYRLIRDVCVLSVNDCEVYMLQKAPFINIGSLLSFYSNFLYSSTYALSSGQSRMAM